MIEGFDEARGCYIAASLHVFSSSNKGGPLQLQYQLMLYHKILSMLKTTLKTIFETKIIGLFLSCHCYLDSLFRINSFGLFIYRKKNF